jgi:hypothetical protein
MDAIDAGSSWVRLLVQRQQVAAPEHQFDQLITLDVTPVAPLNPVGLRESGYLRDQSRRSAFVVVINLVLVCRLRPADPPPAAHNLMCDRL